MPEFTAQDALDEAVRAFCSAYSGPGFAFPDPARVRVALIAASQAPTADQTLAGVESTGERAARHRSELAGADLPPFLGNAHRQVPLQLSRGSWTVWDMDTDERFGAFTTEIEAWSEVRGKRTSAGLPPLPAYSNGKGRELDWPKL